MSANRLFCSFYLDDLLFGLDVGRVQEIIRYQEMTRVPLAPPVVRGLINLRGQIVAAIDLRRLLGLGELPAGRLPMNVVLRTDDGLVSLLVDRVGDVLAPGEGAFEPPPETLGGVARDLIRGAYKLHDRLLLALDADKVACLNPAA
ncbi:MAG TPA: chemotaxis protein CheW [Gemmataceae bacterium]|nr:chemotaxis protein CheW [Gemmataceae bacterium]